MEKGANLLIYHFNNFNKNKTFWYMDDIGFLYGVREF